MAVTMASILEHNTDNFLEFHVFHLDVTDETISRLLEFGHRYDNCALHFHKMDSRKFVELPARPELFFRYVIAEELNEYSRVIHMDVDIVCCSNLSDLWTTDLKGNLLGMVLDDKEDSNRLRRYREKLGMDIEEPYFCAGLLLMDLDGFRREGIPAKLFENTRKFADILCWYDQDMINLVCQGRILQLDKLWNCADRYSPFRRDVRQWHFQGFTQHPWCNLWKNITWMPYLKYLLKSPYRNNAASFVWAHIKGFFFFSYEKKGVERTLVCGILVRKRKVRK
jgi:lipopolysaccharide biosynthesis glycosyltransferase